MENVLGNFNIEESSNNAGNAELLKDLLSTETVSANPDTITPVGEVVTTTVNTEKKPEADDDDKEDKNKPIEKTSILSNFLEDNIDDDNTSVLEDKSKTNDNSTTGKKDFNQFTALSNDLFKIGIFNKDEEEQDVLIDTPEAFKERFEVEKKKGANEIVENFIGQFGEDYQNAFDAIFVNGVNPKEYFSLYNTVVQYAEMDMTQENNQVKVMQQALALQGFDEEDIETEIDRLRNYGDLDSVSVKHHKVLVKKEAASLVEIKEKAEQDLKIKQQIKTLYTNNVLSVLDEKLKTKEFDGIPLSPTLVNEVKDYLLVDNWKLQSGELLTDFDKDILDLKKPENHSKKVKIALLLKMIEKDPSLKTIKKAGITQQTDSLFSEVARQVSSTSTKPQEKSTKWNL